MTRRWRIGPPDSTGYDVEQDERWQNLFPNTDHIAGSALPASYFTSGDGRGSLTESATATLGARNGGNAPGLTRPSTVLLRGSSVSLASPGSAPSASGGDRPRTSVDEQSRSAGRPTGS